MTPQPYKSTPIFDEKSLPEAIRENIRRLLRRCLDKDPRQRMHHIADARIELDEALSVATTTAVRAQPRRTRGLFVGIAAALLLAVLGSYVFLNVRSNKTSTTDLSDTPAVVSERQITTNPVEDPIAFAAISPDGKYVAYNDKSAVRIRLIDTGETRALSVPPDFCYI